MGLSQIVIASGNRHKYGELLELFSATGISLLFGGEMDASFSVEETGDTYEENALLKARAWADRTGMASMADDSGLEVLALGGAPGIHSARAAPGRDEDRVRWLLEAIQRKADRRARFVASLVVALPNEEAYYVAEGICAGHIAATPRGSAGFGYDPIFIPEGHTETLAELGASFKLKKSHRAIASQKMAQILSSML